MSWPAYLDTWESGELERRVEESLEGLKDCTVCPRDCHVNRLEDEKKLCKVGRYARVHLYYHYLANRFLTFMSNVFTGLNLTDMETCYKAFRREVVQRLKIKSKRFTVEPELTAKIARMRIDGRKLRIFEVPISYSGRDYKEGKKIGWRDGIAALWAIVRYRFVD